MMPAMDLKLLEDWVALAHTRSFVRAAEQRHVTHPAFGRRIRSLQAWAGVPLVQRERAPVVFTPAGEALLEHALSLVGGFEQLKRQLGRHARGAPGAASELVRVGTGRTLARTVVADWLVRLRGALQGHRVEVVTRSMADIAAVFERGEVNLLCCYEHPVLSVGLSTRRFRYLKLADDKLVPVAGADARGQPRHALADGPLLGYAPSLALGRLLNDHLDTAWPDADGRMQVVCDSADAVHELALKGMGIAWLPWSMVAADCKRGLLAPLGRRSDELRFEVRMYRPRARQAPLIEAVWTATER
jgi:LysR family transcriptional regulator, hypochlorite-specific transcription factor HypT